MLTYFPRAAHREHVLQPFVATEKLGAFDVFASVAGGGSTGQAGALRLGVARALQNYAPKMREELKGEGFLTRDPRVVERKKPGQAKARKRFQWVKR
jgi:small subunit ribosomal protein S9